MKRFIFIFIFMVSVCCVSITATGSNSADPDPKESNGFVNIAKLDSIEENIDQTVSNNEPAEVNAEESQQDQEEIAPQEQEEEEHKSTDSDSGSNLLLLLLSIVALGVSLFVFWTNKKSIEKISRKVEEQDAILAAKNKEIEALRNALANVQSLQTNVAVLQNSYSTLSNIMNQLKSQISNNQKSAYAQSGQPVRQNQMPYNQNNGTKPNEAPSSRIVRYVSNITINNDGSLSMPIRTLYPTNQGELFMVSWDPTTGKGEYTINPKATDLIGQSSKLQKFTDGLSSMKGSRITVLRPGQLVLEGTTLIVKEKLQIKCD